MGSACLDQVGQTALLLSVYGHEVQSNLFSVDDQFFMNWSAWHSFYSLFIFIFLNKVKHDNCTAR